MGTTLQVLLQISHPLFYLFYAKFTMFERPGDLIPVLPNATSIPWTRRGRRSSTSFTEAQSHLVPWCMTPMLGTSLPWQHTSIQTESLRGNWISASATIPPVERSMLLDLLRILELILL